MNLDILAHRLDIDDIVNAEAHDAIIGLEIEITVIVMLDNS